MHDVDPFEGAYGRLAGTRITAGSCRTDGTRPSRLSWEARPSTALSPLRKRLALLAPARPLLRDTRD